MPHRRTARLAKWQLALLTTSGLGLWLSGICWLLLHYFGQIEGDFGLEVNPAEPWMMKVHGLFLIAALLGIGGMFVAHIPKGWPQRHQRIAGIALSVILGFMIVSGYMLYYVGSENVRACTGVVHWSVGLSLPVIFAWHYLNARRARKRKHK